MTGLGPVREAAHSPSRMRLVVVGALWLAAIIASLARVTDLLSDPTLPGMPWQQATNSLMDYRDVIWVPGRYLLDGGNPYDPDAYLAAHPWAQEFDPYAPAWLLLALVFAPLPYLASAAVYQVFTTAVAVVLLYVVSLWAIPRWAAIAVPAGLLWLNLWYPGRGSLAAGSAVVAVLGVALVVRAIAEPDRAGRSWSVGGAAGIALALIKPQFGLPVMIIAVAAGRIRDVWRGVLGLAVASLPIAIVCSIAAGGPMAFVNSVLRDLDQASSPDAPTGLRSPFQDRIDVVGLLARYGLTEPPVIVSVGVPLLALLIGAIVAARSRDPFITATAVAGAALLGFVHFPYDLLVMVIPFVAGLGSLPGRRFGWWSWGAFAGCLLVVVHVHRVSSFLFGLSDRTADSIDTIGVAVAFLCAAAVTIAMREPAPGLRFARSPS
jgi:hypothetical protein